MRNGIFIVSKYVLISYLLIKKGNVIVLQKGTLEVTILPTGPNQCHHCQDVAFKCLLIWCIEKDTASLPW